MKVLICLIFFLSPILSKAQDTVYFTPDTVYCTSKYQGVWYLEGVVTLVNSSEDTIRTYQREEEKNICRFPETVVEPRQTADIHFQAITGINDPNFDVAQFTSPTLIRLERRSADGTIDSVLRHFVITGAKKASIVSSPLSKPTQQVLSKRYYANLPFEMANNSEREIRIVDLLGRVRFRGHLRDQILTFDQYELGVYFIYDSASEPPLRVLLIP